MQKAGGFRSAGPGIIGTLGGEVKIDGRTDDSMAGRLFLGRVGLGRWAVGSYSSRPSAQAFTMTWQYGSRIEIAAARHGG
jgi:hypothetical protein